MKLERIERLVGVVLILGLAGFFGYGLGYVNEARPQDWWVGGVTGRDIDQYDQAYLDSYGERYAIRKHEAGLEGAMMGVGLALIGLALVPVAVRLRTRLRSRRSES